MADATIYSASGDVSKRPRSSVVVEDSSNRPPKTEYVYVGRQDKVPAEEKAYGGGRRWSVPQQIKVQTPRHVPSAFGNAQFIGYAWITSMILVGFDEWKNNGILPRPVRLWDTSLVYGLLAILAFIPAAVPLANALAIGYTIVLLWQFYNGQGQFNHG
jgi:hypothetical protein